MKIFPGLRNKLIFFFGVLVLVLSSAPINKTCAKTGSELELDGIQYLVEQDENREGDYDGTAVVTGIDPGYDSLTLEIPSAITVPGRNGKTRIYEVIAVGDGAFAMSSVETVVLPDSIKSIGNASFYHCTSLKELVIPANVESIGKGAFSYCSGLDLKVDKENLYYMMKGHVLYTKDMTGLLWAEPEKKGRLKVPSGVVYIEDYAFEGNSSLSRVSMPETLVSIGEKAFYDCSALTRADIPASVEEIKGNPFMYCSVLNRITVSKSNLNYCASKKGFLLSRNKRTLISASAATGDVVIPSKVYYIEPFAAAGNTRIKHITFGKKIRKIGEAAFYDCEGLTGVYFNNKDLKMDDGIRVFGNCDHFLKISVPYGAFTADGMKKMLKNNAPEGAVIITR